MNILLYPYGNNFRIHFLFNQLTCRYKNDDLQVRAGLPVTNNVEVKPLVQHVLSMEHQIFYEKVTKAMKSEESRDSKTKVAVLNNLEHDTGLAQLLPYFIQFICEQVSFFD